MHAVVSSRLDTIRELCRSHGVASLELFGSATDETFDPGRSDLDFIVRFSTQPRRGFDDVYFKLLADLERLFGRSVDLIESGCVSNPFVLASIERTKVPLYAAA